LAFGIFSTYTYYETKEFVELMLAKGYLLEADEKLALAQKGIEVLCKLQENY